MTTTKKTTTATTTTASTTTKRQRKFKLADARAWQFQCLACETFFQPLWNKRPRKCPNQFCENAQ